MGFLGANWMRVMVFACAGAMVLLAGACGSSKSGETERQTPVEGQTSESGVVLEISAREYSFVPDRLQIRQDQTAELTMTNDGEQQHSLSVYEDDEFKTLVEGAAVQPAAPGETKSVSIDPPAGANDLYFRCEIHKDMTGEIEIGPDAAAKP